LDGGEPCLVNFSIKPGLSSKIIIYEFNLQGKLLRQHSHTVPGFCFIHDFAITPHYCIFFQNPVSYNPLPFLFGLKGAGECLQYQANRPTQIIIIPRQSPGQDKIIAETPSGFVFHHANAFEKDHQVYIDSICYDSLAQIDPNATYQEVDFDTLDPGKLWRFSVDLTSKTVERQLIESRCCEFPAIHPERVGREYRYLFIGAAHHGTGNAPLQAILKIDLQTGERQLHSFAKQGYVSEPIFVPKPQASAEDGGWLLTIVYDGSKHRSDVVILDGQDLQRGAIATIHLKHHIPYGLHGSWTPQCFI
jgi:all-trans-8'-apo-beta-carotenal 15,15'-oxygenase